MRYGSLLLVCCLGVILGTPPGTQAAASDTTTITIDGFVAGSVWWGAYLYGATFEATGGIEDQGTAEGSIDLLPWGSDAHWTITLTGEKGTLTLVLAYWGWEITRGTGAYGGARGGGTFETGTETTIWTLTGTVVTKEKGSKRK